MNTTEYAKHKFTGRRVFQANKMDRSAIKRDIDSPELIKNCTSAKLLVRHRYHLRDARSMFHVGSFFLKTHNFSFVLRTVRTAAVDPMFAFERDERIPMRFRSSVRIVWFSVRK